MGSGRSLELEILSNSQTPQNGVKKNGRDSINAFVF